MSPVLPDYKILYNHFRSTIFFLCGDARVRVTERVGKNILSPHQYLSGIIRNARKRLPINFQLARLTQSFFLELFSVFLCCALGSNSRVFRISDFISYKHFSLMPSRRD